VPGNLIFLANTKISIVTACQWAGISVSEGEGGRKTWCPFGLISHSDGGVDRAFRVYEDSNSAYCFSCAKYWTPVSLMTEVWDCSRTEAAERMCGTAGITVPGWRERWDSLQYPAAVDTASLAEALKRWCARIYGPGWETDQFDSEQADPLAACLGVLPLVTTGNDASAWVDSSKQIMLPFLQRRKRESYECEQSQEAQG